MSLDDKVSISKREVIVGLGTISVTIGSSDISATRHLFQMCSYALFMGIWCPIKQIIRYPTP